MTFKQKIVEQFEIRAAQDDIEFEFEWDGGYDGFLRILDKEKKVGEIQFWSTPSYPKDVHIQFVGVDKDQRRKGLAQRALMHLKPILKKNGIKQIEAEITWNGALEMMKKVFGKPVALDDNIRTYKSGEIKKYLPNESPENEEGLIEDAKYLNAYWKL